jgi:adenylate cyclase
MVKTIGDEVMYVSDTANAAALIALRLTERSIGDKLLPETRAGLAYGSMLSREGDYYGPVVNLASRLTDIARPGEVLASRPLTDGIGRTSDVRASRPITRRIRDIGRVEVIRLTRAG